MFAPNIKLRAPEPADLDSIYILENDPTIWQHGVTTAPLSRKQLWDYIDSYDGNIFTAGQLRLVIEDINSRDFLGVVDLYDFDPTNMRAYVGITVIPSMRNKGIGTQALMLLCDYARDVLHMHQLAAITRSDNKPCISIFLNSCFSLCGTLKDWVRQGDRWISADMFHRIL